MMASPFRGPLKRPLFWMAMILAFFAARGVLLIFVHGPATPALPADAYFYLSKAENLIAGRGLTTYWNDGLDRKFFPMNSVVLAPFSLLKAAFPAYWVIASSLYYLLTAAVLWKLVRRIEPSIPVGFVALLLWLANPNVLLWHSVPYAEGLATLLLWGSVLIALPDWRTCHPVRFAMASLLAGCALAARAEAAFIAAVVAVELIVSVRRGGFAAIPWPRLALGGALFLLPLTIWLLSLPPTADSSRISYLGEFQQRFAWQQITHNLNVLAGSLLYETNLRPEAPWRIITMVAGSRFFPVLIGVALAGGLGSKGRWLVLTLAAYLLSHALWHYAYGRFNLLVLPVAVYLFALGIYRTAASPWRSGVSVLLILAGDLAAVFGEAAVRLTPGLMVGGGIMLELGIRLLERRAPATDGDETTAAPRPLVQPLLRFAAGAFVLATAVVMSNIGVHAILRHKQFLTSDDGRTSIRPEWAEAVLSRIDSSTACMIPVDFPLAYRVGSMTGLRVWYSGGLPDFFPPAFERTRTAEFLDAEEIRYILSYSSRDAWAEEFGLSEEDAARLAVQRTFPRGELLAWRLTGK